MFSETLTERCTDTVGQDMFRMSFSCEGPAYTQPLKLAARTGKNRVEPCGQKCFSHNSYKQLETFL